MQSKQCTTKTLHETYPSQRGKTALIHAIELLFYIKSSEFRKYHPSYPTPSAEEFLDYIQSRYRKYMVIPSLKHRPLHTYGTMKSPVLFKQFLAYIHPSAVASSFQSVLGCLFIIVESLSLYFLIKSSLVSSSFTEIPTVSYEEYQAPIYWLLEHKLTSCFSYRTEIYTKIIHLVSKYVPLIYSQLVIPTTATKTQLLEAIGLQYLQIFQSCIPLDTYKMNFAMPLTVLFGNHGVSTCKDVCDEIIKKYSYDLIAATV